MSLDHAIMGFLSYYPSTGYDLKKIFDQSVRHFWSADQSQIYRTLARLTDEGLVQMMVVEQSERPDRKVYSLTPAGYESLKTWLSGPLQGGEARNPVLLQTFFLGKCSDEEILQKFVAARDLLRGMLAVYAATPAIIDEFNQSVKSDREAFFWGLTLEWGQRTGKANLEWVESVIARIENHQVPQK